jgi:thioesterase domain-containing protein
VAYVVPRSDPAPDPAELSRFLRDQLPAHMVPSDFVFIGRIPLTPNGKLDRQALPAPERDVAGSHASRAPRDACEHMLVDIWQEVLGRDNIGIDDDFFELGGYSLLATRVFALIEQRTGKRLPISVLFEAPTIAQLAEAVGSDEWHRAWSSLVPIQPAGSKVPFFYVAPYTISVLQFAQLGEALGHDQPLYGLQPLGLDGRVPAHERVEDMAAHYITELKVVQPEGPYLIGGHCSGAWVAFEMARQLEASGQELHGVLLVDQGPPGADRPHIRPHRYFLNRFRFYLRDGRLRHSMAWQFRIMIARHLVRRIGPTTERFVERVRETHRRAFRLYTGGIIKHDVVLIRSAESLALEDKGWYRQWAERTEGAMTTIDVPGTHANLLVPPFVDSLAEAFTTVFEDAGATRG